MMYLTLNKDGVTFIFREIDEDKVEVTIKFETTESELIYTKKDALAYINSYVSIGFKVI